MSNSIKETRFNLPNQTKFYKGKVRDVYTIGSDQLVMVVSDRISAFDYVLPKGIPFKGQVLNQIASTFLDATSDIIPNWKICTPDPSVTVGKKCNDLLFHNTYSLRFFCSMMNDIVRFFLSCKYFSKQSVNQSRLTVLK